MLRTTHGLFSQPQKRGRRAVPPGICHNNAPQLALPQVFAERPFRSPELPPSRGQPGIPELGLCKYLVIEQDAGARKRLRRWGLQGADVPGVHTRASGGRQTSLVWSPDDFPGTLWSCMVAASTMPRAAPLVARGATATVVFRPRQLAGKLRGGRKKGCRVYAARGRRAGSYGGKPTSICFHREALEPACPGTRFLCDAEARCGSGPVSRSVSPVESNRATN